MKTKISHISKSTLSIILAVMMIISTMAVGMISANAANTYTIYFIPPTNKDGKNWADLLATNSNYTAYANPNYDSKGWTGPVKLDPTDSTMSNNKVYSATLSYEGTNDLYEFQFLLKNNGNQEGWFNTLNDTKTSISNMNGKCYNSLTNQWVTYTPDSQDLTWNLLYGTKYPLNSTTSVPMKKATSGEFKDCYYYDIKDIYSNDFMFRFSDSTGVQYGGAWSGVDGTYNDGKPLAITVGGSKVSSSNNLANYENKPSFSITGAPSNKDMRIYFDPSNKQTWVVSNSIPHNITITDNGTTAQRSAAATISKTSAASGDTVTITARPNAGYKANLTASGVTLSTSAITTNGGTSTFTMPDKAVSITVSYEEIKSSITVSAGTGGTVSTTSVNVGPATGAEVTAAANSGYTFSGWSTTGGAIVSDSKATTAIVTATAAGTVTANFTENKHNVSFEIEGQGAISPIDTNPSVGEAKAYSVTATAASGYQFKEWQLGSGVTFASGDKNSKTITIKTLGSGTYTVKAVFSEITWSGLTATAKGTNDGTNYSISLTQAPTLAKSDSVSQVTGTKVTAQAIDGYTFVGFTCSNADGTVTDVNVNNRTATFKPKKAGATVIAQYKKIHTLTASVNGDGGIVTPATQTKNAGEKFGVTVTPAEGKEIKSVTINGTSQPLIKEQRRNGYKYDKAATGDVALVAEFQDISAYTVTAVSSDPSLGTVTMSPADGKVFDGKTATIKYTIKDSTKAKFVRWDIQGDATQTATTSDTIFITVTGDATVTAVFAKVSPYQVVHDGGSYTMVETPTKGVYISTEKIGSNWWVALKNTTNNTYVRSSTSPYGLDPYIGALATNTTSTDSGKCWKNNSGDTSYYLVYNSNVGEHGLVYLVENKDTPVFIYAKDGTVGSGATTDKYGDTYLYDTQNNKQVTPAESGDTYYLYKNYKVGDIINIRTDVTKQVSDSDSRTFKDYGYYVYAYSINGVKVDASVINANNGIYGANYEITENDAFLEITPIYYNKQLEDADAYITLYVKSTPEQKSAWASTIAIYPYAYQNGDKDKWVALSGYYPGQPMLRESYESVIYSIKVPKAYYKPVDGKMTIDTSYKIEGMTVNNYFNDGVHKKLLSNTNNKQSFDFNDFAYLVEREDAKTVRFDFKYYRHDDSNAKEHAGVVQSNGTDKQNIGIPKSAATNTWYPFKNYYDHKTDIFGSEITDEVFNNTIGNRLYIISSGSYEISGSNNTKGQWATYWYVYDQNGVFKAKGTPADFAQVDNAVYNNLKDFKGCPVEICYDKEQSYDSGSTVRCDGRWYYSAIGREYNVDVKVQKMNDKGEYVDVANVNTADNTCYKTAENTSVSINGFRTATFSDIDFNASLAMESIADGYRFDGWYKEFTDEDGNTSYIPVNTDYKNMNNEVLITGPATYVARVSKIPAGTLSITHEKYSGDDPLAQGGGGIYYVSAILTDKDGKVTAIPEQRGSIDIPNITSDDTLEITLRTVCYGDNTFYAFYEYATKIAGYFEIGPEDRDLRGDGGTISYTFTLNGKDLFRNDKLQVSALRYYSDITKVGGTCTINYKYIPRFEDGYKTYTVRNVELSDAEIQNNYTPSNETIMKHAPNIDTMYLDTKWLLEDTSKVSVGKSEATVYATQEDKVCDVYVADANGDIKATHDKRAFNSLLLDENNKFLATADEKTSDGKMFAYWLVIDHKKYTAANLDYDASTFETAYPDLIVTRCYERDFGFRIMSDYLLVPVYKEAIPSVSATISAPVFNREVSGDSLKPTDKLYVDFLVAYSSIDIPEFRIDTSTNEYDVECGIFVVRNNTTLLSADERKAIVEAATNKDTDPTNGIIANYKKSYNDHAIRQKITDLIAANNRTLNFNALIGGESFRITHLVNDNSALTNKNRIDKILSYTNTEANQNYFFTAYSYAVIRTADGAIALNEDGTPKIAISSASAAQHFNLCYLGNDLSAVKPQS